MAAPDEERAWRPALASVAVLLLCAARVAAAATPNVILITADTLRADHLASYGYFRTTSPVIDQLAGEGLVFERTLAPLSLTLPSHVSLMTSMYPARHGILSNLSTFYQPVVTGGSLQMMAQMFKSAGYSTAAFTSSSPLSADSGVDAGFDVFRGPPADTNGNPRVDIPAEETVARALAWLDTATPPFFLWVHLFDPHYPYSPPPPFDRAFADEPGLFGFLDSRRFPADARAQAAQFANGYDGEILYMDGEIGKLFWKLRQRGLYDGAAIVFAGDHGEGLMQHAYRDHGLVWNEQLLVPLVFKWPRDATAPRGRRSDLACLIDVLPTLVAGTGLPFSTAQFDGVDLLSKRRESVLIQRGAGHGRTDKLYGLITPQWKYLHYDYAGPTDELYDLDADPYETANVASRHADVAAKMKSEVVSLVEKFGKQPALREKEVSPEARERLRQLGYGE